VSDPRTYHETWYEDVLWQGCDWCGFLHDPSRPDGFPDRATWCESEARRAAQQEGEVG
jgi:hypothetical protein